LRKNEFGPPISSRVKSRREIGEKRKGGTQTTGASFQVTTLLLEIMREIRFIL
jgi:hypothetical protein